MDQCASVLLAFPPDTVRSHPTNVELFEEAIKSHCTRVTRLFKEQGPAIAANAVQLLDFLNPAVNSLSYLALLEALLPGDARRQEIDEAVRDKILTFLLTFDARQIRFYGSAFTNLFSTVGTGHVIPPSIAVDVLAKALLRIDPTGFMLTTNHLTLVKLAYHTNFIAPALPVISKNVVFVPGMANQKEPKLLSDPDLSPSSYISKETGLTANVRATHVLEYDYIVGLMYCALRDWAAARDALGRAVSYPTKDGGVSTIMVEAHKKWILMGLLLDGKTGIAPPLTSANATKALSVLSKRYLQVAESFNTMQASALRDEAQSSGSAFLEDSNQGLMEEVVAAHQKWQIAKLRHVYSKVSIAQIRGVTTSAQTGRNLESDDEVETLIQSMLASGMIQATIHKPSGRAAYLEFLPAKELSEAEYAREVAASAEKIKVMVPVLKATNERLGTGKDYIRYLVKEQKREKEGGRDAGFEEQIDDEDIMDGLTSGH